MMKMRHLHKHLFALTLASALLGCGSGDAETGGPGPAPTSAAPAAGQPATGQARGGVLLTADLLPAAAKASLAGEIAAARANAPSSFERLQTLRAELPALDAAKRGRLAPMMPSLVELGPDALWPMLEEIAFDAAPRGELSDTAWVAWRASLLEATGKLRDARAEAVLRAVLEHAPNEVVVARAAAQAYAKLNTPAVAHELVQIADRPHPQRLAFLEGFGHCRQPLVANKLGELLGADPPVDEARALIAGLGVVGSKWAWETPIVAQAADADAVRARSAQALVAAFARYGDEETRRALVRAILVVDHPETAALVEEQRATANGELATALDRLAVRVANNPLDRYEGGLTTH